MLSAVGRHVLPAIALALATACAANPSAPAPAGPLQLIAQANRTQIAAGETAMVTFRLQNLTSESITLDFSSGCQVMPYVARRNSDEIVYPGGGGWVCTMALTKLTVPPSGEHVVEMAVAAGGESSSGRVGLPRGEYSLFARVDSTRHKLESNRVNLTVR